jgi:hypothetical protein
VKGQTRKKRKSTDPVEAAGVQSNSWWQYLLRRANRGLLLDIVVFIANVFLMRMLSQEFFRVLKAASDDRFDAQFVLFLGGVALFVLPPLGATLKRWHFHQRLQAQGKDLKVRENYLGGCLFNPIFYFCLTVVIFSGINAYVFQLLFKNGDPGAGIAVTSILFGMALMITHTFLVYRFFSPPKAPPKSKFLLSRNSETIGDICIFVNMLLLQLVWNLLTLIPFDRVSSLLDLAGRLFLLSFVALLIYFPPRMFYLAEDIKRFRTWAIILLANSPVIIRVLLGTGSGGWE